MIILLKHIISVLMLYRALSTFIVMYHSSHLLPTVLKPQRCRLQRPPSQWTYQHGSMLISETPSILLLVSADDSVSTLKEISRIPGNPYHFRVIFGKWNHSRKFQETQEYMENTMYKLCKHVEKYDFYGLKIFHSLQRTDIIGLCANGPQALLPCNSW